MDKKEHLYKILVIGNVSTGKTSIIKRYVHKFTPSHYKATIGVDFAMKILNWNENTIIRLQFWDIEGQERYGNITRVYYKDAVGCFLVFDVTRPSTFDAISRWKHDLDSKVQLANGQPIPCLLLANKCDQPKEGLAKDASKIDSYCKKSGFIGWFETSATEDVNIENAVHFLVENILQCEQGNDIMSSFKGEDSIDLVHCDSLRSPRQQFRSCCS